MGAALDISWTDAPSVERVLGRLVEPARAFVRLHFVAVACLAADVERHPGVEEARRLIRACMAVRGAIVLAAWASHEDPLSVLLDLSREGDAQLRRDVDVHGDRRLVRTLDRLQAIDARIRQVIGKAPRVAAGPGFGPYVERLFVLDAALLLTLRASDRRTDRDGLLNVIDGLASELERSFEREADPVVLPSIGADERGELDPECLPQTGLAAEDVEAAARSAFTEERVADARELVALGLRWHPDHGGLSALARAIAAPTVRPRAAGSAARDAWLRSRAWVAAHTDQYAGRWVAVWDGRLLGAADRPQELVAMSGLTKLPSGTLVTRVARG
ncbi:MAG: hypothetical protein ABMA64_37400 [Myxococcota bacterium]